MECRCSVGCVGHPISCSPYGIISTSLCPDPFIYQSALSVGASSNVGFGTSSQRRQPSGRRFEATRGESFIQAVPSLQSKLLAWIVEEPLNMISEPRQMDVRYAESISAPSPSASYATSSSHLALVLLLVNCLLSRIHLQSLQNQSLSAPQTIHQRRIPCQSVKEFLMTIHSLDMRPAWK